MNFYIKLKGFFGNRLSIFFSEFYMKSKLESGRLWEPFVPRFITPAYLLKKLNSATLEALWSDFGKRPYCTECLFTKKEEYEASTGDSVERILKKASEVMENKVNLFRVGIDFFRRFN